MAGAKAAGGNGKNGIADKGNGGRNKPTSASQMQRQVEKGQAPKTVVRVDKAHNPNVQNQKPHVHFDEGTALNNDGTIHDVHSVPTC